MSNQKFNDEEINVLRSYYSRNKVKIVLAKGRAGNGLRVSNEGVTISYVKQDARIGWQLKIHGNILAQSSSSSLQVALSNSQCALLALKDNLQILEVTQ